MIFGTTVFGRGPFGSGSSVSYGGVSIVTGTGSGSASFAGAATGSVFLWNGAGSGAASFVGTATGSVTGIVTGTGSGSVSFAGTGAGSVFLWNGSGSGTATFTGSAIGIIPGSLQLVTPSPIATITFTWPEANLVSITPAAGLRHRIPAGNLVLLDFP